MRELTEAEKEAFFLRCAKLVYEVLLKPLGW